MTVVIRNIPRAPQGTVQAFANYGVATVHEAQGRSGLLAARMRPVWHGARAVGSAVTVAMPPCDNWMLHVVVEQCQPGDIVIAAPTSPSDAGYFGELLATSFATRGVSALVIDAGVRDVAELEAMRFPVWSSAINAQGTVKETLGGINVPIICAGALVHPGDIVVADADGVVIVPRAEADQVLAASQQREQKEEAVRARLKSGELGLDIYGMREKLAAKGLVWRDAK